MGCRVVARELWGLDSLVGFFWAFWAVGFGVAWALAAGVLGLALLVRGLWCVDSWALGACLLAWVRVWVLGCAFAWFGASGGVLGFDMIMRLLLLLGLCS